MNSEEPRIRRPLQLLSLFERARKHKSALLISITSFASVYILKSSGLLEKLLPLKSEENHAENDGEKLTAEANRIKALYLNKVEYIQTERIENLASFARLRNALTSIRFAQLTKNQHDRDRVVHELIKLSNLNDGLIQIIAQTIRDDRELILSLATNPRVDNRILPNCPPSLAEDLRKYKRSDDKSTPTLAEDDDFNFIFDFYMNKISNLKLDKKSVTAANIRFYVKKFFSALNSLLLHDYKLKKHNTILNDLIFLHDTDLDLDRVSSEENNDVEKEKTNMTKHEFLSRLEYIILQILDSYAKLNEKEFIKFGGVDILLILYEKHKTNMEFLIPIFDILTVLSLKEENKALFVNSGWVKRIHELCVKLNNELNTANLMTNLLLNKLSIENYYKSLEKSLILKLIVYKIMFNLKSQNRVVFSDMIYPLYPLKSEANHLDMEMSFQPMTLNPDEPDDDNESEHAVDVVFIHGLLGSVFKTWRQDDHHLKQLYALIDKLKLESASIHELDTRMNELRDKLKTIYDNSTTILPNILSLVNYTYCWPKDWLAVDFHQKINVYGVNYSSILSYWGGADDKTSSNNSTIKMRSSELIKQLDLADIGKKPIIWVCHSMGGLLLKQMLLNLASSPKGSSIIENTKGIVFYSTPHLGSALAKRAMNLSLALWPSKEIDELALNNKYLIKLNQEFIELISKKNWKIVSFCESFSTHVGYNLYVKLVDENSAKLPTNLSSFQVLEKDHLYVCKPDSKESVVYKSVFNLINDAYTDYNSEKQRARKQQELKTGKNYYKKFKNVNYFFKEFLF